MLLATYEEVTALAVAPEPPEPFAAPVDTDSLRRRAVNFGQLRTNYSPTLTATEPADTFLATDDYTEPGWAKYQAVARYTGIPSAR